MDDQSKLRDPKRKSAVGSNSTARLQAGNQRIAALPRNTFGSIETTGRMFQPRSTPFAASFYQVGGSSSTISSPGYDDLGIGLSSGGDELDPVYVYPVSGAAPGGPVAVDSEARQARSGLGVVGEPAGQFADGSSEELRLLHNLNPNLKGDGSGAGGFSGTSGQEHPEPQHLLYSSQMPMALAPHNLTSAAAAAARHSQPRHLAQVQAGTQANTHSAHSAHSAHSSFTHSRPPGPARNHTRSQHPAYTTRPATSTATVPPNHHPSPPLHALSHHNPNLPIAHFVQPASSCNQRQQQQHHYNNNGFSIPSPAGSAASSSNAHIPNGANDPSSAQSYSANALPTSISIATPAASSPSTRARSADMAGDAPSDSAFQNELVAQQRAAESYQPQLEGPVIGDKCSSDRITEEYAKADPFYVEKTITYSHFRAVQGDGNCGWRAIGFSYFEHLVLAGEPERLHHEVARLTSLNNYLSTYGGYDLELFEDMVLETINLLKDLAQIAGDTSAAMTLLMQRFNDRECSNAIIYHLRLLAGAWLKGNAAEYEPFLDAGGDVTSWAHLNIEVPDKEIDHLSIMLLSSILLKPIGFVLEIAYLDRTPGSMVNTYRFPDEANGQDSGSLGPIIYLLFRPDHYDILYKDPAGTTAPVGAPAPVNLQVHRAASFSQQHQITSHPSTSLHNFATLDYSPLAMLPGFCGPTPALPSMTASSPASPMHDAYTPTVQSSWMQAPFPDTHLQQPIPPPGAPPLAARATPAPAPSQQRVPASTTQGGGSNKSGQPVDYQLRFSSQCFHLKNPGGDPSLLSQSPFPEQPSFTTTMFKNSHFNKAHYNNPHFHPEEWTPDDEPGERCIGIVSKKKPKARAEY